MWEELLMLKLFAYM